MGVFFSFIIPTSRGSVLVFGCEWKDVLTSKCTDFQPFRYLYYVPRCSILLAQTSLVTSSDTICVLVSQEHEEA